MSRDPKSRDPKMVVRSAFDVVSSDELRPTSRTRKHWSCAIGWHKMVPVEQVDYPSFRQTMAQADAAFRSLWDANLRELAEALAETCKLSCRSYGSTAGLAVDLRSSGYWSLITSFQLTSILWKCDRCGKLQERYNEPKYLRVQLQCQEFIRLAQAAMAAERLPNDASTDTSQP